MSRGRSDESRDAPLSNPILVPRMSGRASDRSKDSNALFGNSLADPVRAVSAAEKTIAISCPDDPVYVAELQTEFPSGGRVIADTANRGMTLQQLERVIDYAARNCSRWYDSSPLGYSKSAGNLCLMETNVNLYVMNGWVILPATQAPLHRHRRVRIQTNGGSGTPAALAGVLGREGLCTEWKTKSNCGWEVQLDDGQTKLVELGHLQAIAPPDEDVMFDKLWNTFRNDAGFFDTSGVGRLFRLYKANFWKGAPSKEQAVTLWTDLCRTVGASEVVGMTRDQFRQCYRGGQNFGRISDHYAAVFGNAPYQRGAQVRISGNDASLFGKVGKLLEWVPTSGQWGVDLGNGVTCEVDVKYLKPLKVTHRPSAWLGYAGSCMSGCFAGMLPLQLTEQDWECAFVELLAEQDQPPHWFVSHWWGERVRDFAACVRLHAETRLGVKGKSSLVSYESSSQDSPPYWICAYANRQHSLSQEVVEDPKMTSFYRAMLVAKALGGGTLLILDDWNEDTGEGPATPFSRIWCAFEESISIDDLRLPLDIAACHDKKATLLTEGVVEKDKRYGDAAANIYKAKRERDFPIQILAKGLKLRLEEAQATSPADRRHILNCLAGQADLNAAPLKEHPNYDKVNKKLHATFAIATWAQAITHGAVDELMLANLLKDDVWRHSLVLDVSGCSMVDDKALESIGAGLPPSLEELDLGFGGCEKINLSGVVALTTKLPGSLRRLALNFRNCKIGDNGVGAIANGIPQGLHTLHLDLESSGTGAGGMTALWKKLPGTLRELEVKLDFLEIGDDGIVTFGSHLPDTLESLGIDLQFAKVGEKGLSHFATALGALASLQNVRISGLWLSGVQEDVLKQIRSILEGVPRLLVE